MRSLGTEEQGRGAQKILVELQAKQTLHLPCDLHLCLQSFGSHTWLNSGTTTALTAGPPAVVLHESRLLMQLFPLNTSLNSFSLPQTFAAGSKPRLRHSTCLQIALFQGLLSVGFGSTCRVGFLPGLPFKTQHLQQVSQHHGCACV